MNKLFPVVMIFCYCPIHAQVNLIPNNSFERVDTCGGFLQDRMKEFETIAPVNLDSIFPRNGTVLWFSPCYLNNETARTDSAAIGTLSIKDTEIQQNEQVQFILRHEVIPDEQYYIEYWIKSAITTKSFKNSGVFFTNNLDYSFVENLPNEPVHFFDTITIVNKEWTKISGCIQVDSSYKYMVGFAMSKERFRPISLNNIVSDSRVYIEIDDVVLTPIDTALTLTIPHDTICIGDCITLASNHSLIDATFEWDLPGSDYNGQDTGFIKVCYNQVGVFDIGLKVEHCAGIFENNWEKRIAVIAPPNQIAPDHQVIDIKEGDEIEIGCVDSGNVQWIPTDGLIINGLTAIATDQVFEDTLYSCMVGDTSQCGLICTYEFRLQKYPIADFEVSDLSICEGDCISIHNQSTHTSDAFTYIIQGDESFLETIADTEKELCLDAGNYTLTLVVWNDIGQDTMIFQNIEVIPFPNEINPQEKDITVDYGDIVQLTNPFNAPAEWSSPTTIIPCIDCNSWSFEAETNTTIDLTSFFDALCSVSTQFKIRVENIPNEIYLPTAITPNGDGINDKWKPFYDPNIEILQFRIYDRWGGEVFHSDIENIAWDGNAHGKAVEQGVYVVVVTYKDVKGKIVVVSGDLTVFR